MPEYKWHKNYNLPASAYQRVSLKNSGIPGRAAKSYNVSYYKAAQTIGSITVSFMGSLTGEPSLRYDRSQGLGEVPILPPSTPAFYDPLETPGMAHAMHAVRQKLIDRVRQARYAEFNAAVFFGELPKALHMFANTATRIYRAQMHLRKGNLGYAYEALGLEWRGRNPKPETVKKRASNYFLEMKYGWLPLLKDLDDLARKVADELHRKRMFRVSATVSVPTVWDRRDVTQGWVNIRREGSVRGVLTYAVANERIAFAASLGFTNPMAIAWEATPLSFVFDWILPVGDFLTKLSAFHGLEFVDGSVSRKGSRRDYAFYPSYGGYDYEYAYGGFRPIRYTSATPASVMTLSSGFHRSPLTDFPAVAFPEFEKPKGLVKALVAMALITQRR